MSTERRRFSHWSRLLGGGVLFGFLGMTGIAAQVLAPAGTGQGVHGANSPYAPLADRADVLPWKALADVKTVVDGKSRKSAPLFGPGVMALHQKTQRVQGFVMPLEPGERQKHFLLSSVPLTCSFCLPGGPESIMEVKARTPVRAGFEPVVLEGQFQVLSNDPYGIYYRLTEAVVVK